METKLQWNWNAPIIRFFDTSIDATSIGSLLGKIEETRKFFPMNGLVQLLINSTGGDLKSAAAFLYYIQDRRIPLMTLGYTVESAAMLLYLAGKKRFALPDKTKFFVHEVAAHIEGEYNAHSARSLAEEMDTMNNLYADLVVSRTSFTQKELLALMNTTGWLNAKEAKKAGIVHEFIET